MIDDDESALEFEKNEHLNDDLEYRFMRIEQDEIDELEALSTDGANPIHKKVRDENINFKCRD